MIGSFDIFIIRAEL